MSAANLPPHKAYARGYVIEGAPGMERAALAAYSTTSAASEPASSTSFSASAPRFPAAALSSAPSSLSPAAAGSRFSATSPAYQNLRQKVDNFVSTHLDKQEWNPTMNKNQLRNGLRQSVVQSGMLEAGVDRIISQVVDPKLNHIFRPQIERAIHEFLAAKKKEAAPAPPPEPESQDAPGPAQDAS
ncbi:PREDICTED: biorientation of chromosomes in cell division protein 1 [Myotis brandtii]|uniref:biorientation of chromosomes in cell division protein 1 n=1 Tax=Myotis brandtii TaxID=109478 RepID=UPI000704117F|nr:PREDICTED: biorientation of chromosomes in cell division protein 1 [Myotis brandtii]